VEVNAGLVIPFTTKAIIGDKEVVAFFVLLFMALTSTISSSMIAVSSILTFDIYKSHINPNAPDRRLVHVSHLAVVAHAVLITGILLGTNYGRRKHDLAWLLLAYLHTSWNHTFDFFTCLVQPNDRSTNAPV
jgi:Na+/proline symporter